ncbi:membrane-associated protein, putative [Bodo saltans]|uniref:Membrane-associated protein, putative n=1 Tax=Bodo saltans TaxID=75058 RepID=A0A0S4INL1_BODSA|nr:membrane-associated protein, putative [Bodo saltans]|eukprot:CUE89917.1 membrane-associated protein, putative [Bodo saltans]
MLRGRVIGLLFLCGALCILLLPTLQGSPNARDVSSSVADLHQSTPQNEWNEELRLLHANLLDSKGDMKSTGNNKQHVVHPRIAPPTITKQAKLAEDDAPALRDVEVPAEEDSERDPPAASVEASRRGEGPLQCNTTWHPFPADPEDLDTKHDRQGCHHRQSISCTGKRLRRALVIYMLQTKGARDMNVEMHSFDIFMNSGVFGEHESTEMFEGVDYIFTRMRPRHLGKVLAPTIIAEKGNIKLMWVPAGPCDLCAHGRVITHLGGVDAVKANYSFIALLNGGARGPFQAANDAPWIDVMAIGGQATWSEATPPIMVGPTVSTQVSVHIQTYCIGIHSALLAEYYPCLTQCSNSADGKGMCIRGGEIAGGKAWMRGGGWIHALGSNVTLRSPADVEALAKIHRESNVVEPMHHHFDLCAALFPKFGGSFTRSVRQRTAAHAAQLVLFQPFNRVLSGRFLLQELLGTCNFLHLGDILNFTMVIHAWYGVPGKVEVSEGVVERLWESIEQHRGRLVVSNNLTAFFGFDPAPNVSKVVAIHVRYNEKDEHLRVLDGEVLQFPDCVRKAC